MQQEQNELLQALYEGYQGALRYVASNIGIPYGEIDDIIQDTFCAYIRAYGDKLLEWNEAQRKSVLMRILKNRCADYFRDKSRNQNISMAPHFLRSARQDMPLLQASSAERRAVVLLLPFAQANPYRP